jgi:hypothetical protein
LESVLTTIATTTAPLGFACGKPQNPTTPEDFRRDTFNKLQADINRCIGEIFGKTAKKIPTQTLDNAPNLDVSLNGRELAKRSSVSGSYRSILGLPDPNKGKNGTVVIHSGAWNYPNYPHDVLQGAYIHEYGNILSSKYGGGDFNKFGDKAGIEGLQGQGYRRKFPKMCLPIKHQMVMMKQLSSDHPEGLYEQHVDIYYYAVFDYSVCLKHARQIPRTTSETQPRRLR